MIEQPTPGSGTSSQGTGTQGTSGQAGEGEEVARLRSDNTKLRMQLAENEKISAKAVPLVRLAQSLLRADGGKEIVEKLEKGEPLTKKEEKVVQQAQQQEGTVGGDAEKPLTLTEAKELFGGMFREAVDQFGQTVAAERKAAENVAHLDEWAEKELEGYKFLKHDPQFQHLVETVRVQISENLLEVPKEEEDVWRFIVKTAHRMAAALHNEGGKKKAGKDEKTRVAEALKAGGAGPSSATQTGESDLPKELQEKLDSIRRIGTGTIGRSFAHPKK